MPGPSLKRPTLPGLKGGGPALKSAAGPSLKGKPQPVQDAEADSVTELNELQAGFKERAEKERQRFLEATDSEYWVAVCFQTRAEKEEFLEKLGLLQNGDKYLEGRAVARALGVTLETPMPPVRHRQDRSRLADLARPKPARQP